MSILAHSPCSSCSIACLFLKLLNHLAAIPSITLDLASHPILSTAEKAAIFHRGADGIWIAVYAQKGERLVLAYDGIGEVGVNGGFGPARAARMKDYRAKLEQDPWFEKDWVVGDGGIYTSCMTSASGFCSLTWAEWRRVGRSILQIKISMRLDGFGGPPRMGTRIPSLRNPQKYPGRMLSSEDLSAFLVLGSCHPRREIRVELSSDEDGDVDIQWDQDVSDDNDVKKDDN
ncbi:hypothetical protein B0T26DRAFT_486144 [Lasiosphaeria miniovina]|uniref:Uncharacterized protein n=1 Tax=Lasiosphaeria miniovina TaxID=1954250 RepID=A0AA40DKA0_9PEZI|nr:uncharacterized protein B0T26DRAFT_486144 [Lasiosphaeria miniovina]KAK0702948.1 hypothetical protein B0T26DRAFT_486144 [Lasiosphaeria miniovina]